MLEYISIDQKAIGSNPTILLSMSRAADRRLIRNNIPEHYQVIAEPTEEGYQNLNYDLCITDLRSFTENKKTLLDVKNQALPGFLPLILLVENSRVLKHFPEIWEQVDDIIEIPVPMKMLNMRIKNQLRSRYNSLKIVRQNEKLRLLEKAIHSTEVGITITDTQSDDNPIIFANEGFTKLTGYQAEEITGRNCRFLQNDDRDQDKLEDIRTLIDEGKSGKHIIRNYTKEGTLFWNELSISPVKTPSGDVTHFIGIQNDVTELINTQKELKEEKNLLHLVTDNSTDMISRHSVDGTYLYVTPSSEKLMGYTPEELIGQNAFDFIHPDDVERVEEVHRVLHETPNADRVITTIFRKRSKSGDYKWVESLSRASVNPEDKNTIEIQINTRDISTRKKYQDELNEALAEKNVLLQEIHHRVKNNLAVISGLLQIQQFDTDNEMLQKILGNSISRIKTMALIHEKLYSSHSLSHLQFKEYIEDLLSSIMKTQDHKDTISIHIDCDDTQLNVNQGVPCALILNEAISNAIEHAFPNDKNGNIWVRFKEKDDQIDVTIKDDGTGLPEQVQRDEQKTMGMTIIYTLLKQLNAHQEISGANGTEIKFSFKRQNVKGAHSQFI
jgi:PAS domain S-box-containing protein